MSDYPMTNAASSGVVLADAVKDQVPEPDPGFFRTIWEVALVSVRRSLGRCTRAPSIHQAPHMVTEGGYTSVSRASMTGAPPAPCHRCP